MRIIDITGVKREEISKSNRNALRREDRIPCVLYGNDENIHFSVTLKDVKDLIYTHEFKTATLDVSGKKIPCILKSVQFHPVKDTVQHIDFLTLNEGVPVKVNIPLSFAGTAAGLKSGGQLIKKLRKVLVKATPDKLVDELEVDITDLMLGQSLRVRDIAVEEGMEILNNPGTPVATVEIPRLLRTAAEEEEEELEEEELEEGEEAAEAAEGEEGGEEDGDKEESST